MSPKSFKRIVLADRPKGQVEPDKTFKQVDVLFDASMNPGKHSALVQVHYVSLGALLSTEKLTN
jgi:hypothetical protein